jgi:hypothetical protein
MIQISFLFKDIICNGIINNALIKLMLHPRLFNEIFTYFNTELLFNVYRLLTAIMM